MWMALPELCSYRYLVQTSSQYSWMPKLTVAHDRSSGRVLLNLRLDREGCYHALATFGGVKLKNGEFTLLVLTGGYHILTSFRVLPSQGVWLDCSQWWGRPLPWWFLEPLWLLLHESPYHYPLMRDYPSFQSSIWRTVEGILFIVLSEMDNHAFTVFRHWNCCLQ